MKSARLLAYGFGKADLFDIVRLVDERQAKLAAVYIKSQPEASVGLICLTGCHGLRTHLLPPEGFYGFRGIHEAAANGQLDFSIPLLRKGFAEVSIGLYIPNGFISLNNACSEGFLAVVFLLHWVHLYV